VSNVYSLQGAVGIEEGYVKGLSRGVLRASSGVEGNVEDVIFKVTRRGHGVKGGRWRKDWKKARRARLLLPPRQTYASAPARCEHVLCGQLPRPFERVPPDEVPRDEVRREPEGTVALGEKSQEVYQAVKTND
jgi:hypothetical protein